ncbi:MAG TPA: hypothetical protein VIV12_09915 [Streptosporangiaceae bacterium]
MGQQIIRQPDGYYAVFSSITDTIIMWDASAEEVVEWFTEQATEDTRRKVNQLIEKVAAGERAYYQFTMTWNEALAKDERHGGDAWKAFART